MFLTFLCFTRWEYQREIAWVTITNTKLMEILQKIYIYIYIRIMNGLLSSQWMKIFFFHLLFLSAWSELETFGFSTDYSQWNILLLLHAGRMDAHISTTIVFLFYVLTLMLIFFISIIMWMKKFQFIFC